MPISRYRGVKLLPNNAGEYSEQFKARGVKSIAHFSFSKFKSIKLKEIPNLQMEVQIWKTSDRYYKFAEQYYGDSTYWWIIALFNNKPLESDIPLGHRILIPMPLEMIISAMEI